MSKIWFSNKIIYNDIYMDVKATGTRAEVFHGNARHTSGGLTRK